MVTTRDIIEAITAEELQRQLGLGYKSINRAAATNKFPASWAAVIKAICLEKGLQAPNDNLFSFINRNADCQSDHGEHAS